MTDSAASHDGTLERTADGGVIRFERHLRYPVAAVWDAITNPDMTSQYFYGTLVESDWEVGSEMNYFYPDGSKASEGHIISIDAPKRIEFTFQALWDEEMIAEGPAREVWALAEVSGMVQLTIELYDVDEDSKTLDDFSNGFPYIVSGLKSLIETGEALPSPY